MQNILSILQDFQKQSQFLQIKKIKEKYFLSSVNDTILKYSDDWQTESTYQDIEQGQQTENEIEITSLFMDFNKYFMNLFQKLIRQNQTLKMLITNLLRIQQKSIFDQNTEERYQSEINRFNQSLEENELLQKYPENYQTSDKLQDIINNYQNLIYILLEQESVQILFKNPLNIDFNIYKLIQLETLILGYTYFNANCTSRLLLEKQNYFDTKIKWLLEYEQYSIFVNDLRLEIGISSYGKCDQNDSIRKNIKLPEIQANYITLFVDVDGSIVYQIAIDFAFSEKFDIKQRLKVLIYSNADYLGKEFYCSLNNLKQIPSILDDAYSFINSPFDTNEDIIELFFEDQYILMLSALQIKKVNSVLHNSIQQILSDLLIN
ncbi:hypothetical protein TTHERM_00129060 (macronuclear) [Tetrahymena thermophila SB210]|uniref:Uncharacterized protein n=1 Tax=Tetrahymena thermophila (strain SB210) TaxID=312017 RepID=I7M1D9_TETTS|nr:hypothetical protein TTHERM_00129060 [Tetrahymena thermophila SB210]EAR96142.1 hypothetical protein TTHERM_00129060 [Tetrahymena thermophila SB210]|eukprot:XP_001016387.1 hypothetical protein TTHERM_00129060 [Tetrahymena thermophila SB210]